MENSEGIKETVNQTAMQTALAVMMAFKDTEPGLWPAKPQISKRHKDRDKGNNIRGH